jgi:hypothetical protein
VPRTQASFFVAVGWLLSGARSSARNQIPLVVCTSPTRPGCSRGAAGALGGPRSPGAPRVQGVAQSFVWLCSSRPPHRRIFVRVRVGHGWSGITCRGLRTADVSHAVTITVRKDDTLHPQDAAHGRVVSPDRGSRRAMTLVPGLSVKAHPEPVVRRYQQRSRSPVITITTVSPPGAAIEASRYG